MADTPFNYMAIWMPGKRNLRSAHLSPLTVLLLFLFLILSWPTLAAKDSTQKDSKPLTNADVLDMLHSGISQDIVIAKIKKSACEFDTSPEALKALKTAHAPDAVVLAMVEAVEPPSTETPARVNCSTDTVPVFSDPRDQANSVETFRVNCGDKVAIIETVSNQSWLRIRSDGRVGYISRSIVSIQAPESAKATSPESDTQAAAKQRDALQKAADDLEDCRTQAQNEYDTKMGAVNTLTVTPIQRVYAASRLKQNYDVEVKSCRTRYEWRVKSIEAQP